MNAKGSLEYEGGFVDGVSVTRRAADRLAMALQDIDDLCDSDGDRLSASAVRAEIDKVRDLLTSKDDVYTAKHEVPSD